MNVIITMAYRQVLRFLRAKSRVISTLLHPIIWIAFFGLGWSRALNFPQAKAIFGGVDYLTYLVPGVVAITIFTTSFMSGMSVIIDKDYGFLKEILVAPVSRSKAIFGRILGDSITSLLRGLIILIICMLITPINVSAIIPVLILGILLAWTFSSIGITFALRMSSLEGFGLVMNMLTLPLMFLSGAFYPIDVLPLWIRVFAYINPLTYAVDGMRHLLTGVSKFSIITDFVILGILCAIFLLIGMYSFEKSTIE
ncbi:ABC transporter permease [Methanocaldococcus fervens]|uniref:Daunorubicin resistance ABC transporter, inner membrane subunit B n=1 Tax=Methanocaldococcus fervens (strain DSM 4213 / JCM 15782 / AG86) TaxID=573064 RepID=C7P8R2_METFA|nr:ABC transporter permease [Methanocaldococcus fervens]ACV24944.1 daunorubicin resistance ABC transporter, inner membrane subunit B [Methanocaldococcus fervens AG86]